MEDVQNIGGTPGMIKFMMDNDLFDGDQMTVTGKTHRENLADHPGLTPGQDIIRPLDDPDTSKSCTAICVPVAVSPKSLARKEKPLRCVGMALCVLCCRSYCDYCHENEQTTTMTKDVGWQRP